MQRTTNCLDVATSAITASKKRPKTINITIMSSPKHREPKPFFIEQNKIYKEYFVLLRQTLTEIVENDKWLKRSTKGMLQSEIRTIDRLLK